jgi:hypothetical protein
MSLTFNMLYHRGNLKSLLICRGNHKWLHSSYEFHYDGGETHWFTCKICSRTEIDLSNNWKYLKTDEDKGLYSTR